MAAIKAYEIRTMSSGRVEWTTFDIPVADNAALDAVAADGYGRVYEYVMRHRDDAVNVRRHDEVTAPAPFDPDTEYTADIDGGVDGFSFDLNDDGVRVDWV